jgi:hypothetical protein
MLLKAPVIRTLSVFSCQKITHEIILLFLFTRNFFQLIENDVSKLRKILWQ